MVTTKELLNGGIPVATKGTSTNAAGAVKTAERIDALTISLRSVQTKIQEVNKVYRSRPIFIIFAGDRYAIRTEWFITRPPFASGPVVYLPSLEVAALLKQLYAEQQRLGREINRLKGVLETQKTTLTTSGSKPSGDGTKNDSKKGNKKGSPFSKGIIYNASAVKESYFYSDMSFFNQVDPAWSGVGATNKLDTDVWSGNTPGRVDEARKLWKNTVTTNSKGIIQTWKPPGGVSGFVKDSNWATLETKKSVQRYGFQFLYNPTTISMSYGGVLDVDPGLQSSGKEEFLASNPSVFQSTINIEVVLNRMFDMKYLTSSGLKSGQITDFYAGNLPEVQDLRDIYEKGTMYDVEYLLQTMFPYEPTVSQLRGKTSDVGYLGASPVELHLGNRLRYVAQINSINVNHVIFDNRMVPMFTTVSISANRIPDYQGVKNDTGGGGSGGGGANPNGTKGTKGSLTNPVVPGGGSLVGGIGIR